MVREREKDIWRGRQSERVRKIYREKDGQRVIKIYRQKDIQGERYVERKICREKDMQRERYVEGKICREKDMQRERYVERKICRGKDGQDGRKRKCRMYAWNELEHVQRQREHRGRSFNSYELATAHSIAHIDSAARARIERKFSVLLWHYALKRSIAAAIPLCRD